MFFPSTFPYTGVALANNIVERYQGHCLDLPHGLGRERFLRNNLNPIYLLGIGHYVRHLILRVGFGSGPLYSSSSLTASKRPARTGGPYMTACIFLSSGIGLCAIPCAREFAWVSVPELVVAGAARTVRALADNFIPEIFRDVAISAIAGNLIETSGRDHLQNVRVQVRQKSRPQ